MPLQAPRQASEFLPPAQEFSFRDKFGIAKRFDPTNAKLVNRIGNPFRTRFTYAMESGDWFLLEYNHLDGFRMIWTMVSEFRLETTLPLGHVLTAEQMIDWYIRNDLELPPGLDGRHRMVPTVPPITDPRSSHSAVSLTPNGMEHSLSGARHSNDFRSVHWFNHEFTFTPNQAKCVNVLWNAWANGTPDVSEAYILETAEVQSVRLRDVFKQKSGLHPAWKTMIQSGLKRGTRRLVALKTDSSHEVLLSAPT